MTRLTTAIIAALAALMAPALAQQNQTPGDTGAGGTSGPSRASTAQAGANTTDGTTTGSSGPKSDSGGPPGNRELPPLPSEELCTSFEGEVRTACLATTLYQLPQPIPGPAQ